jgi:hypothetical protein
MFSRRLEAVRDQRLDAAEGRKAVLNGKNGAASEFSPKRRRLITLSVIKILHRLVTRWQVKAPDAGQRAEV